MSQIVEAAVRLTLYVAPWADVSSSLLRRNRWHLHRRKALAHREGWQRWLGPGTGEAPADPEDMQISSTSTSVADVTSTPPNGVNIKQQSAVNHPDEATFMGLFRSPYRSHEARVQREGSASRLVERRADQKQKHAYHT